MLQEPALRAQVEHAEAQRLRPPRPRRARAGAAHEPLPRGNADLHGEDEQAGEDDRGPGEHLHASALATIWTASLRGKARPSNVVLRSG